jgi:DNA-binding beta-propeller fold protein YncE
MMLKKLLGVLSILIGSIPVVAQVQGALLVVTKQSHALAIVDGSTLQVLAQVPIGEDPHEVVVGPDRRTAYVSNYGEGTLHTLAVVDLLGQKALPSIDLSPLRGAHGLTLHDGTIWFTAEGSKALGTLNPATGRVESVLGTGQDKTHLVWVSRDGRKVVASNAGSATMSVFDQTVQKPVMVPGAPAARQPTPSRVGDTRWSPSDKRQKASMYRRMNGRCGWAMEMAPSRSSTWRPKKWKLR